jgi:predicted dehydrogenase
MAYVRHGTTRALVDAKRCPWFAGRHTQDDDVERGVYRVAIIGGRRGLHHARGYEGLEERARVVALAEIDAARRAAAHEHLGVTTYADWHVMLDRERPHILHAVTSPLVPRAQWVEPAAAAGVRVLVIEKPLALTPAEASALARAVASTGLRVVVNHQRRYMPFADALLRLLADEAAGLGPVHFARCSTMGKVMDLGPHLLDLGLLALGDTDLTHVWAAADGFERHPEYPGPRRLLAEYTAATGARLLVEATPEDEPALGSRDFAAIYPDGMPAYGPHRCNIDIWAERGRFWWREHGSWGYQCAGLPPHQAAISFPRDDLPAQRALTAAIVDWLDGGPSHRCRFELAQRTFVALVGACGAARAGRINALPSLDPASATPLTDADWATTLAWLRGTAPASPERGGPREEETGERGVLF